MKLHNLQTNHQWYKFTIGNDHAFDVTLMFGSNRDQQESTTASADLQKAGYSCIAVDSDLGILKRGYQSILKQLNR